QGPPPLRPHHPVRLRDAGGRNPGLHPPRGEIAGWPVPGRKRGRTSVMLIWITLTGILPALDEPPNCPMAPLKPPAFQVITRPTRQLRWTVNFGHGGLSLATVADQQRFATTWHEQRFEELPL